ncbi:putative molybdenum cofactor guanylyltransferase [compost metagenome]
MMGLVLCGGQSSRMGTDKGSLLLGSQTWASLAATKLKAFHIAVNFSINSIQKQAYSTLFEAEQLIIDDDTLNFGGPLKGILSAHLQKPTEDIFVLACDLVNMNYALMASLLKEQELHQDFEAYVFKNSNFYEPLCGIYTAKGLNRISKQIKKNNLQKYNTQAVLKEFNTFTIPISTSDQYYFKNFNSPREINELL